MTRRGFVRKPLGSLKRMTAWECSTSCNGDDNAVTETQRRKRHSRVVCAFALFSSKEKLDLRPSSLSHPAQGRLSPVDRIVDCVPRQLCGAFEPQLQLDVLAMGVDRFD